jgi:DNA-binding transcriptional MerR regulator
MRLTIDELAQRTGTSSRNIRAHQAKGLLPGPQLEGRTGYYVEEHVRRLEIINDLQDRGFSLAAIKQVLDAWSTGGDLSSLLGFHHVLTAPWTDEEPVVLAADELFARFPESRARPELVERSVAQGLIEVHADGTFGVPSPLLVDAGAELNRAGVPLEVILDLVAAIRRDLADVAERFVDVIATHVMNPVTEGTGDREPDEVIELVRRLRPVALEVVRPFLAQELTHAIERTVPAMGHDLDAGQPEAS